MRIAVIPARGGSKRVPRKNVKPFRGKPMIAYSIEAALSSTLFDHVIVSTEDPEITRVAIAHGASVPFVRPRELADDFTSITEVLVHAVEWMQTKVWAPASVCCIYATAPFIDVGDLRRGAEAIDSGYWDYAFAVTDFPAPIFRAFSARPDGGVEMFFPGHFETRSQDLPVALHDAGQFCFGTREAWLGRRRVFGPRSFPVIIPRWRVQDIDTLEDWKRAELIHEVLGWRETGDDH
jgi:pseudaminic acid cytidylyltransferase